MTARNLHLIVVGSGIAGLYGSLLAAESGLRVTVVTKGALAQSNTHFAQGGICAVLQPEDAAPGDSVEAHIADTLKAGAGQCNPEAVRILCSEAGADIATLERFGVAFDRDHATGRRSLGLEGAHSAARILHAGGDATGAAIADDLISAVRAAAELGTLRIMEHTFVRDLVLDGGRVAGVRFQGTDGSAAELPADAVLLASGGAGQLFEFTTNPSVATADGLAAAWRAGAAVADLEYFQFHPTALAVGGNFLISEAVRGAGAVLRDSTGTSFMAQYHPEADLAPRDVVSRGIAAHLARFQAAPGETVFLDATGVEAAHGAGYLARRFPTIAAKTRELGFDWTREWLPVTPAAHYWMGGVATNLDGQTSLPGLYAAGEVACTGVHGANRLASNSLLEGIVFGRRAVACFVESTVSEPGRSADERSAHGRSAPGRSAEPQWLPPAAVPLIPEAHVFRSAASPDEASLGAVCPGAVSPAAASPETAGALVEAWAQGHRRPFTRKALRELMSAHAGVVRDANGLSVAAGQLAAWRSQAPDVDSLPGTALPVTVLPANPLPATAPSTVPLPATPLPATALSAAQRAQELSAAQSGAELENLRLVAELLVHAALARESSAGAHFRSDFPREQPATGRTPAAWVSAASSATAHFSTSLPVLESETV
ncbi:L-aspartate oxidase [Arthrobacter livingstonensis]|uniref:L-aspartate oxidase n=1 Tax=Arthrobacter livingstonensis TaxID=670078 RepID=UPI001473725D|nr:FAD-dependent oxidoreductase [Arthrobacter livingstonensis]